MKPPKADKNRYYNNHGALEQPSMTTITNINQQSRYTTSRKQKRHSITATSKLTKLIKTIMDKLMDNKTNKDNNQQVNEYKSKNNNNQTNKTKQNLVGTYSDCMRVLRAFFFSMSLISCFHSQMPFSFE